MAPYYRPLRSPVFLKVPFRTVAVVTVSLPLFAFLFCIIYSLMFNFRESTSTHCGVRNLLPSISAAIGGYTPQRYVWRICIGFHSTPRLVAAMMYLSHYQSIIRHEPFWQRLALLACLLNVVENLCLVGLTFVSSSENYPIHEKCFVLFMLCSLSYMLLSCLLPRLASKLVLTPLDLFNLKVKSYLGLVNVSACLAAVYFFLRHNWYCEPMIYTFFAFSEYIVVLTNMAFHMTAYWDFYDHIFYIGACDEETVEGKGISPRYKPKSHIEPID